MMHTECHHIAQPSARVRCAALSFSKRDASSLPTCVYEKRRLCHATKNLQMFPSFAGPTYVVNWITSLLSETSSAHGAMLTWKTGFAAQ